MNCAYLGTVFVVPAKYRKRQGGEG